MKLLVVAVLAACSSTPAPKPVVNSTAPDPPKPKLEVQLQRTACMGRCPMYTLEIHDDNSVHFDGQRNVPAIGERRGTITVAQRDAVIAAIEKVKFFDYGEMGYLQEKPTCTSNPDGSQTCTGTGATICTDTPHSVFTITLGKRSHKTVNQHCEDSPLDALEATILDATGARQWINGNPTM